MRSLPSMTGLALAKRCAFRTPVFCLAGLAAVALMLVAVSPALASTESPPLELVSEEWGKGKGPHEEGRFSGNPEGIAVNDVTGDVYVADTELHRVQVYNAEGAFKESWGWGVGDEKEEFERCGPFGELSHPECIGRGGQGRGLAGEGSGQFGAPRGVAVDQATGEVFVEDSGRRQGVIQVFTAGGVFVEAFGVKGASAEGEIQELWNGQQIAMSESGAVYILDRGETFGPRVMEFRRVGGIYKYARTLCQKAEAIKQATGLATDATGNLFIAHENKIYKLGAELTEEACAKPLWKDNFTSVEGMSVDRATGNVYFYSHGENKLRELNGENGAGLQTLPSGSKQVEARDSAVNPGAGISSRLGPDIYVDADERVGIPPEGFIYAGPTPKARHEPIIESVGVEEVGSSVAALRAEIDPNGYQTSFRFQYGSEDCSSHVCAEAPLGGGQLGLGKSETASVTLSGLQPDATYHYRVLATNQYGTVEGEDRTFTTFPAVSAGLPDDRAYELVSPPFKDGGEVIPPDSGPPVIKFPMQAAPDGGSIVYEGYPFAAVGEAVKENEYLSRRTAGGWQTADLAPERMSSIDNGFVAFSPDLSAWAIEQSLPALAPEAPVGYKNLYLQRAAGADMQPLITSTPPHRAGTGPYGEDIANSFDLKYAGASADFKRVFFEADDTLTEEVPGIAPAPEDGGPSSNGRENLYEWTASGLRLVNVLPDGESHANAVFGSGFELESSGNEPGPDFSHAVSADGSRVFWTDRNTHTLYVRENGEKTVKIPDPGVFITASPDGTKVLLNDGHIYDLETEATVDLTEGHGGFQGLLGAGEDLSKVYFVDTEALTGVEQNGYGASARTGEDNAYAYDATAGSLRFIGTLAKQDDPIGELVGDWNADPGNRSAQASNNGRYLVFMSENRLTRYDNTGAAGIPVFEVFEYDSATNTLSCASCGPVGISPAGSSSLPLISPQFSHYPQPHWVSDTGQVFFDSSAVLSPFDTNGSVQDVYEFEPAGAGSCTRSAGCTALISGGVGGSVSEFVDATPSGSDVFFITREQLVREDQDDLVDLYDARVGGGFAAVTEPICTGTGCQGVPGAPPIFATPSSVTFSGVGNFESSTGAPARKAKPKKKTVRCAKGRKRRKGRCVKAGRARGAHRSAGAKRGRG